MSELEVDKSVPHLMDISKRDLETSYGSWHHLKYHSIPINGKPYPICFRTVSTITGCGLVQLAGVSNFVSLVKEEIILLKKEFDNNIIPTLKKDGVGAILATLGQSYYSIHDTMITLGFVQINEFSNYRHGQDGRYKQRIYLLTY